MPESHSLRHGLPVRKDFIELSSLWSDALRSAFAKIKALEL